jgi:hypothetical protein
MSVFVLVAEFPVERIEFVVLADVIVRNQHEPTSAARWVVDRLPRREARINSTIAQSHRTFPPL